MPQLLPELHVGGDRGFDVPMRRRRLDIRVATLPTVEGEAVVMRLLDKSRRAPTLEELGLSEAMQTALRALVHRPTGAVLVTGA